MEIKKVLIACICINILSNLINPVYALDKNNEEEYRKEIQILSDQYKPFFSDSIKFQKNLSTTPSYKQIKCKGSELICDKNLAFYLFNLEKEKIRTKYKTEDLIDKNAVSTIKNNSKDINLIEKKPSVNNNKKQKLNNSNQLARIKEQNIMFDKFVKDRANINVIDENGRTLLHKFASLGRVDITDFLISKGLNINSKDEFGDTPLHLAAAKGQINVVKFLVEKGADIKARNKKSWTPLHSSARWGHPTVAAYLINRGLSKSSSENPIVTPNFLAFLMNRRTFGTEVIRLNGGCIYDAYTCCMNENMDLTQCENLK